MIRTRPDPRHLGRTAAALQMYPIVSSSLTIDARNPVSTQICGAGARASGSESPDIHTW